MRHLYQRRKLLALTALTLVVLWLGGSFLIAYIFTRRAKPITPEPVPVLTWGTATPVTLTTKDRDPQTLGAWFIPGQADRPICLMLHGNGGRRSEFLTQAEIPASAGCGVMMVSLRAHGDSSGEYNDIGYSAQHDVNAAVDWLEKNHPDQPVVIFGQSMGSAAAVFAAKALGERVQGYILDCPYRDLWTAVDHKMTEIFPPVLNTLASVGVVFVAPWIITDFNSIAPVEAVRDIPSSIPVLVLVGSDDHMAPPKEVQSLIDNLGSRARMVELPGGTHGKLHLVEPPTYHDCIREFCQGIECRRK